MYVCIYVCMYACMYVCIYMYIFSCPPYSWHPNHYASVSKHIQLHTHSRIRTHSLSLFLSLALSLARAFSLLTHTDKNWVKTLVATFVTDDRDDIRQLTSAYVSIRQHTSAGPE